jgi:hypothetical protein
VTRIGRLLLAALAVVAVALGASVLVAPSAHAAGGRVIVQRTDPLSIDPVRLLVAAADGDGWATPFTGTVTLSAKKTSITVPVSSATGQTTLSVSTTTLAGGPVKAVAVLKTSTGTVRTTIAGLVDLPSTVVLKGFGCGVITPAQKQVAWQVAKLNGAPIIFPAWTQAANTFPAYIHTVRPGTIADSQGQPLSTKGSVAITSGTTKVATIPLKAAVRRLLFTAPWAGTVKGRFTPGSYTATITLTDPYGRVTTAAQPILVARSSAGLCS